MVPKTRNGILFGSILMCLGHLTGTYVLVMYAATIFNHSKSSIDANLSSVVMGCVLVVGVYSASVLVDRIGRKILMLVSTGGSAVFLVSTGVFSLMVEWGFDMEAFDMVPVVGLSCYVFFSAIGMLTVPYIYVAEIFPQRLRRIACAICVSTISACAIIQLKTFPLMLACIGLHGCMFVYASVAAFGMVFTVFVMDETKGRNLDVLEVVEAKDKVTA